MSRRIDRHTHTRTRAGQLDSISVGGVGRFALNGVEAAHWEFVCGVTTNQRVVCWGVGHNGQLGNGAQLDSNVPVQVLFP